MNKKQILQKCKQENVSFVNMQFCDLLGAVKSVTIPVSKLDDAISNNVWFDGSSIEGFTRIFESDMYLKPDLNTFAIVPWESGERYKVARIICDVYLPDGTPFMGDPRHILKSQIREAQKRDFEYYVGPELEFFLFELDENNNPLVMPHDNGGYFDYTADRGTSIRQAMSKVVSQMGIDVETIHHEVAPGQHEIDFKYSDAITQADAVLTVKTALKAVARQFGLHATFMPKPVAGINGSGMHVHQSLFKEGENSFYNEKGKYNISDTARNFIGGQLKHIEEFTAVTNPLVNSYKRLVPGYEAPVYISWGQTNRSALIRVPRTIKGKRKSTRCELRSPDSAANPYLAFAMMLASGLKGINQDIKAPSPIEEDIFQFTEQKTKKMKIKTLPTDLGEAITNFSNSTLAKQVFGKHAFSKYIQIKNAEFKDYQTSVSQWEIRRYLENN